MPYVQTVAPAAEPVTLAEAKLALRIDDSRFDTLLPGYITAARERAEHETGRVFMPQTWQLLLEDWPDELLLTRSPVAAVSLVEYHNGTAWTTVNGSLYVVLAQRYGAEVRPAYGTSWPTLGSIEGYRVRVTHTAGYANAGAVPEQVKTFIKAWVGCLLDDKEPPAHLLHLLDAERAYL